MDSVEEQKETGKQWGAGVEGLEAGWGWAVGGRGPTSH